MINAQQRGIDAARCAVSIGWQPGSRRTAVGGDALMRNAVPPHGTDAWQGAGHYPRRLTLCPAP